MNARVRGAMLRRNATELGVEIAERLRVRVRALHVEAAPEKLLQQLLFRLGSLRRQDARLVCDAGEALATRL